MISYVLAPNPVLQLTDNQGNYVPYGTVLTLDWDTRQPKATYFDPGGLKPRPNPFPLDSVGRAFEVYWEDDAAYYLLLANQQGQIIWQSAEPFIPSGGGGGTVTTNIELENLIINGQMRFAPIGKYEPIPVGETFEVALGGWSFIKDGTNTDDLIQFVPFTIDNTAVDATPIFYFNYVATSAGTSQTRLDLQFRIKDVRSLSAEQVTVSLEAIAFVGGAGDIDIIAVQNFGSTTSTVTPSAPVFTTLATITPTASWAPYSTTNILPSLTGKTVSDAGDDFLGIIFRMPLDMVTNLGLTNFYFKRGAAANNYPYQTYAEVLAQLNTYPLPNYITDFPTDVTTLAQDQAYDVLSLKPSGGLITYEWLPPVPTGSVIPFPSDIVPPGWVEAKGQDLLQAGQYKRLFDVPFSGGKTFGTAYGTVTNSIIGGSGFAGSLSSFFLRTTEIGVSTGWSVGNVPFTFLRLTIGHVSDGIEAISFVGNKVTFRNTENGLILPPVNTTGMVLNVISLGGGSSKAEWEITGIAGTSIPASSYVSYETYVSGVAQSNYIWFKKDGVGTDPGLAGIGHEINITSSFNAGDTASVVNFGIDGNETWMVTCVAASSIMPGEYFETALMGTTVYAPYYRIDGSVNAPTLTGTLVPIDILSTDTSDEVAAKTFAAFNPLLWKMPDWRGSFIRFWDDGRGLDPDAASRTNRGDGTTGDHVGTYQTDSLQEHRHDLYFTNDAQAGSSTNVINLTPGGTIQSGPGADGNFSAETRPKNYYFNCIVKY